MISDSHVDTPMLCETEGLLGIRALIGFLIAAFATPR
jgi:hypothetical protein